MNKSQIKKQYDLSFVDDGFFSPNFVQSAFENKTWPVIASERPDTLAQMSWGLIPRWTKDEESALKYRSNTVNARVETVKEKPSFRKSVNDRRCMVLADGFFEYRELNGNKYPYFVTLKNKSLFSMAGLYDEWVNVSSGEIVRSFSIMTTEANSLMKKVHNRKKRMPVILNYDSEKQWLGFNISPEELAKPYSADLMDAWTISKLISSRTQDRNVPELIEPFLYPEIQMSDSLNI